MLHSSKDFFETFQTAEIREQTLKLTTKQTNKQTNKQTLVKTHKSSKTRHYQQSV